MAEPESTSRVKKLLHVTDQHTKILGYRVLNSQLSLYIGMLQLVVCVWALTQHVYSIYVYDEILFCDFENTTQTNESKILVGVDAIIFDIGLFHSLWGIHGCVAQHLDGGYGRFTWCISHTLVLVCCLPIAFVNRPRPQFMWPLLVQQSAYGIGLLILSLAALPRILPTFMGDLKNAPIYAILFYLVGASLNYVLLYVYYHWYWHVEAEYYSAKKLTTNKTEDEEIVDPRRRPFHYDRIDKPFIPRAPASTSATPSPAMPTAPHSSRACLEVYPNGFVKQAPMLPVKQPPPPPSNLGYIGYCNGDIPSYRSSSQRPSLASNASSLQLPVAPYPQQRQLPPQRRNNNNNMNGHLLVGTAASGSDPENAYTSDDSAATTALASGTCCHYYDQHNQIRAATASPFASTAQARYNKFIHTSGQIQYRKTSLTPGGAPLSGGRVVGPSPVTASMYSHHRNGGPVSVSCTNSPKWSRHGTPTIADMPNTII
uniref:Uncharacterized protein n=1 Tax=Panagrellus redivivus TaxID=6233 RepID=A0A7E4UYY9_PANRE